MKIFKNEELLQEICDTYGYELIIKENEILCVIDGGNEDDEETYKYNNLEEGLIDWLDTLIESENNYIKDGVDITWSPEIKYIESLKNDNLFEKNCNYLNNTIVYGEIPSSIYPRLSTFIKEQVDLANKTTNSLKTMGSNIIVITTSIPVEFTCIYNELKYIKASDERFLNRLIFDKDTSEVDFFEQLIFSKEGLIESTPLLPINEIQKFELNIPVSISLFPNGSTKIETPINYKKLF